MATLSRVPLDTRRSHGEESSTDRHIYGGVRDAVTSLSLADKSRRTATPGEMLTPSDDEQDADETKLEARPKLRSSARLIDRKNTPNHPLTEQQRPRTVPSPPQVRDSPGDEQKSATEDEPSRRGTPLETTINLRKRQRAGSVEGVEGHGSRESIMDHNHYQHPSGPSSHNSSADHSPYSYHHQPQHHHHHQYPPSHPQHDYRPREYPHVESQYLPRPYDGHGPPPEPPNAYRGYYGTGGGPLPPLAPPLSHHQSHHSRNDSSTSSTAPYGEPDHQGGPYGSMTATAHFQQRGHHKPGSSSDGSAASSTSSSRVAFAAAGPIVTDQTVTGGHGGPGTGAKDLICVCPKAPKVPRPRNVFILYRQAHQSQVGNENPGLANPEISKLIGERWRAEPEDVKDYWKQLAEREKERHSRQYPDYRYQPRRGGKNASSSSSRPATASGEDPCRCGKCGGRFIATPRTPTTPFSGGPGGTTGGVTTPVSNKSIQSHHHPPQPFISPDPRILETQHLRRGSGGSAMVDAYGRRYTQPPQLRDIDEGQPLVSPTSPPPSFQQQHHSAEKRRRTETGYAAVISPTSQGPPAHAQYPQQHPMAHDRPGPGPAAYGPHGGVPLPLPPPTTSAAVAPTAPSSGPHIQNHHHQHTRQHSYPPPQPQSQRYQSYHRPSTSLVPEDQSPLPLPPSLPAPRRKTPFDESLRLPPLQAQGLPAPGPPSHASSADIGARLGTTAATETTGLGIVHETQRGLQEQQQQEEEKRNRGGVREDRVGLSWQWKLDTMRAICPPLPQDGSVKTALSIAAPAAMDVTEEDSSENGDDTRGPIIAVEGVVMLEENDQVCNDIPGEPECNNYNKTLLLQVADAVETALEGTCRFGVRKWGVDGVEKKTKDDVGDQNNGSNATATEEQADGENKKSKTQTKEEDFTSPLAGQMENMLKWHRASGEMIRYVTRRVEVNGDEGKAATPAAMATAAKSESANVATPSSATGLAPAPLIHPAPRSSSSQRRWRHNQGVTPAALISQGYSLSLTDRDAASLPIRDNYAAADHWRWVSTLWRGVVGADLSIVVVVGGSSAVATDYTDGRDIEFLSPPPDDNMAAAQQLQNLARGGTDRKTGGDLASSYSMVVRIPEGGHLDDKLGRRLGYELIEWIHAQQFSR